MLDEMIARALRHADDGAVVLPRLQVRVSPHTTRPQAAVHGPMLHLVLQGAKLLAIGDRVLRLDPACCFVNSLDLPASGRVVDAAPGRPFVAMSLSLGLEQLETLLPELPPDPAGAAGGLVEGFVAVPVTPALLDPCCRLLRLLDQPGDAPVLAPLIEREILYRLLRGPQGPALCRLARPDGRLSQVRQATGWIRSHYDRPLRVEHLARMTGMSVASFHRHFRAATGTTPLRYQKSLRLQHARRQLLGREDVTRVGHSVGYGSLSQFSREYTRMFGLPPSRDVRRMLRRSDGAPS